MKQGILLIAVGHDSYLQMARTLAASIKFNDPSVKIALASDKPAPVEWKMFDQRIHVPEEYFTTEGKLEYIKVKTYMYDLSPFQETIFLDVDMIFLRGRKASQLFQDMKNHDWMISNTGPAEVSIWADIIEVKKAYKTSNTFYNYHSEILYFKKLSAVKKYFDKVKQVFETPKVKGTNFGGARIADELAFQIASMVLNYYPSIERYLPTYWFGRNKNDYTYPYKLDSSYFSYSIGGNTVPQRVKDHYNNLAKFYFTQMNLQRPYQVKDKKSFLPERFNV